MLTKNRDGAGIERDRTPAASRLRLADRDLAPNLDDRLYDAQPASVEVDVGPAHTECFSAAHAGRGEQEPQRVESVAVCRRRSEEWVAASQEWIPSDFWPPRGGSAASAGLRVSTVTQFPGESVTEFPRPA